MQGVLYEEPSVWLFLLVTCLMGGWAAWMTGRAVAITWGPYWQCVLYLLLLAGAVRFIHFALFNGTLLSLHYYLVDAFVVGCDRLDRLPLRPCAADDDAVPLAVRAHGAAHLARAAARPSGIEKALRSARMMAGADRISKMFLTL